MATFKGAEKGGEVDQLKNEKKTTFSM